jgi:putative ABC transport system substrate-binding protein
MKRREFITLLGGAAAACPLAARAQQPKMRTVGYLHPGAPEGVSRDVAAFRRGLNEVGYIEGENVVIEARWAEGKFDRLPALAADLARRKVAVIFAVSPEAVLAIRAEDKVVPIVFFMGEDPVKAGIVDSLNRPNGNVTGFSNLTSQLVAKRLAQLCEVAPNAAILGLLVNQTNPNSTRDAPDARAAASALGRQLHVLIASTERDFEPAFNEIAQRQVGALCVGTDPFFVENRQQLIMLAERNAMPTIYDRREFPASGGLMSYGTDRIEANRQCGIYVGRIIKGVKPIDLPVQQSTKFEFVINLKTAKAMGLAIPERFLLTADEVIE